MLRGGATNFYEADGLGSVTSLSTSAGAVSQTYTYDSFGNTTTSSGSLTNFFRYTARDFDSETNLYEYRARYYDPTVGRFLSEDPIQFDGGINFYAYTANDPVGLVDPSGLTPGQDSKGYFPPANLNDPQMPDTNWPYPSSGKFFGVNMQCVSLTRHFINGLPCTDCWRAGPKVIGNTIPAGTPVATFDSNGLYPAGPNKNSGIYVKGLPGNVFIIIDQWGPYPGLPPHPASARPVRPEPGGPNPSNDSGSYSVITVPPGTKSSKCKCGNW